MLHVIGLVFKVEGTSDTTEKVKKSLSSFLGVITDTLAPPPDKTIDCDVITLVATPTGTTEVYDSTKVSTGGLGTSVDVSYLVKDFSYWSHKNYLCAHFSGLLITLPDNQEYSGPISKDGVVGI